MACTTCHSLSPPTLRNLPRNQTAVFFVEASALRSSATAGSCPFCKLLWETLALYDVAWSDAKLRQSVELRVHMGGSLKVFWRVDGLYLEMFTRAQYSDRAKVGGTVGVPHLCPTIGPAKEIPLDSNADECFKRIAHWLDGCTKEHSMCGTTDGGHLPTRVIDVGLNGEREPHLYLPSADETGYYAALSYCWGKTDRVLQTTRENLEQHLTSITFGSLPRTLQDAVVIARRLAIPYLWVDALCIIQGDADDWAYEASKMCDVYSNAYLTISASNSSGSDQGIFGRRSFGTPPHTLHLRTTDGHTVPIYVRKNIAREHNRYNTLSRGADVEGISVTEPITKRAWTLQEGVLTNRIIHYTSEELVWECNECYCCECGYADCSMDDEDEFSFRAIRTLSSPLTRLEAYEKWNDLVFRFCERQLSYDDDRLAALSGLAKQFQKLLANWTDSPGSESDQYLAGVWEGNLIRSLLWNVEPDMFRTNRDKDVEYRRPSTWRAPSWTWAAVEGPIQFNTSRRFVEAITSVSGSVQPRTNDPTGQVVGGTLKIMGKVIHGLNAIAERRSNLTGTVTINGLLYSLRGPGLVEPLAFLPDAAAEIKPCASEYSFLLLGTVDHFSAGREVVGLVLARSTRTRDAYQRVGITVRQYHVGELRRNDGELPGVEETLIIV